MHARVCRADPGHLPILFERVASNRSPPGRPVGATLPASRVDPCRPPFLPAAADALRASTTAREAASGLIRCFGESTDSISLIRDSCQDVRAGDAALPSSRRGPTGFTRSRGRSGHTRQHLLGRFAHALPTRSGCAPWESERCGVLADANSQPPLRCASRCKRFDEGIAGPAIQRKRSV